MGSLRRDPFTPRRGESVDYRLADAMDGPQIIEYLRAAFGAEQPAGA
jgi:hypothetical protein